MSASLSLLARTLGVIAMVLLQGCATVKTPSPSDPLESMNRSIYGFNDALDKAVLKPVATVYRDFMPKLVRKGVSNFLNNLDDIWSAVNVALQGRGTEFGDNVGRVMVNSTVGLGGLLDVASELNIERHSSGFGLTLGRWGVGPGPYLVLPLLGPSTVRDAAALPLDYTVSGTNFLPDPNVRTALTVTNVVELRASLLGAGDIVEGAALDSYSFLRDAYLQRKRNQIYDGNPPDEDNDNPQ